jgi:hypothetical protein
LIPLLTNRELPLSRSRDRRFDVLYPNVFISFFASDRPSSAAINSILGIVHTALIGFKQDLAWTNLSSTVTPVLFLKYAMAEYTSCGALTKMCSCLSMMSVFAPGMREYSLFLLSHRGGQSRGYLIFLPRSWHIRGHGVYTMKDISHSDKERLNVSKPPTGISNNTQPPMYRANATSTSVT